VPSSYQPLVDHLAHCCSDTVTLTFEQIEGILGRELPVSARTYRRWWGRGKSHARAWTDLGWRARPVDIPARRVTFSRVPVSPIITTAGPAVVRKPALLSGIEGGHSVWYWEGNIQKKLADQLVADGWTIVRQADAAVHEHGMDLLVRKGSRELAVEVKGYPSTVYERGPKRGLSKPTRPTTQARHWFGQAVMSAIWCRHGNPTYELAIAFPDKGRVRGLVSRSEWALDRLGIGVYLIDERGHVHPFLDHRPVESG
jgi:hypothetical protein